MELKIQKALVDGFWLPIEDRGRRWIRLKYEKLSDYCYGCGKLGHVLKSCGDDAKNGNDGLVTIMI